MQDSENCFNVDLHSAGFYEKYIKRKLDIIFAFLTLLLFWWLYLIIAIAVRIKLGKPVLFSQERPGKDEKIFKLYKFRSMTNARDENGQLLADEMRLTKFGKILRSTSLDELPEVINILKGDMSLVGPRPLLSRYLPYYTAVERQRHNVRPGLTGLAQVNGRNLLGWEERLKMDVAYTQNISFYTDFCIILKTIKKVIKREDIRSGAELAMVGKDLDEERKQTSFY